MVQEIIPFLLVPGPTVGRESLLSTRRRRPFLVFFMLHTAALRPWHIYNSCSPPPGRDMRMRLRYVLLPVRSLKIKTHDRMCNDWFE
jgi:hypothetical protein